MRLIERLMYHYCVTRNPDVLARLHEAEHNYYRKARHALRRAVMGGRNPERVQRLWKIVDHYRAVGY